MVAYLHVPAVLLAYANGKGSGEPGHPLCTLVRAFCAYIIGWLWMGINVPYSRNIACPEFILKWSSNV